jgi:hypothetical protein
VTGGTIRGWVVLASVVLGSSAAHALDKQGSAHGGQAGDDGDSGFNVAGAVTLGSSIYNPSYAARPDNTGLALMRYAAHADIDLIGRKLSLPLDVNMFSDRLRSGLEVFAPSELDIIAGVTTTWTLGPGALELGSRFENDRPVGGDSTFTQSYIDVRGRYLYSLASDWAALAKRKMDFSGWATLGVFAWNPTYAARPDNSGHALFRYGLHAELSLFDDLLSFGMDGVMFTDRDSNVVVQPSELDLTPEVIIHVAPFELHVAYERDLPLTQSDYSQTYVYALLAWSFDMKGAADQPLESRGQVLSP